MNRAKMTSIEIVENLEYQYRHTISMPDIDRKTLQLAATYMRKIAAGELKPMVHAHWIPCTKECYDITDDEQYPAYKYCSHCKMCYKWAERFNYCPFCGAPMDKKENKDGKIH